MSLSVLNEARKRDMTPEELSLFHREYEYRRKKKIVVAILLLLFGGLGVHRFYLGHNGYGIAMLIHGLTLGLITFLVTTFIWLLIELCIIWSATDKVNSQIESEIIDRIFAYRTAKAQ